MTSSDRRVLVLGASGMMGNTIFRLFCQSPGFAVAGTVRSAEALQKLPRPLHDRLLAGIDIEQTGAVERLLDAARPEIVINCIGLVKQLPQASDPLRILPLNALLPHRLARACQLVEARLVHLSTDCVFDGKGSLYRESDFASADDLYGRSKLLGEVDYPNAITVRISTIGHELGSHHGLLEWFLAQDAPIRGFTRAIFSGLSTLELAKTIRDFVVPNPRLHGLYHVSGEPIAKFELLQLVAEIYQKRLAIAPDDSFIIDRSLDSSLFRDMTGYRPPSWPSTIRDMRQFG